MDIVNETPYALLPFDCTPTPKLPALTLIVKGTFKLRPGQVVEALAKDDQPQLEGDDVFMDDLGRSLRYPNDLVAMKIRGEVTVNAVAHCREGQPRPSLDVSIAIGPIQKTLRVTGDRRWSPGASGEPSIGRIEPFTSMPIRWELAFGGLSHAPNPLGRGIDSVPDDSGAAVRALPNVESAGQRVTAPRDRPQPAGFGAISPMWDPRLKRQGTRDQRWAAFRAPLPPQDFDPRFYNAAPEDQQLAEGVFFRGDETLTLTGLNAELPVYETMLPGKRLRLFVFYRRSSASPPEVPGVAPPRFHEVVLKLDTVHVDATTEQLSLVWRQPIKVKSRAHFEIEAIYLAEEELAHEPLAREVYYARFEELSGPKVPPLDQAVALETEEQMAEAKKVLKEGKVDPAVLADIEKMKNPQDVFDRLMQFAQTKVKDLEALTEKFKGAGRP